MELFLLGVGNLPRLPSGTELGLGLYLDSISRLRELALILPAESFKELRLALKEARVGLRLGEGGEVEVAAG